MIINSCLTRRKIWALFTVALFICAPVLAMVPHEKPDFSIEFEIPAQKQRYNSDAEWPMYGGDDSNTANTSSPAPYNASIWQFGLDGIPTAPIVAGNSVYVGTDTGTFYRVNASTGTPDWAFDAGSGISTTPALFNQTVVVATSSGTVHFINATTGLSHYEFDTTGPVYLTVSDLENGTVFIGDSGNSIHANYTSNGSKIWSAVTSNPVTSPPAVGGQNHDVLFLVTSGDQLITYNATTGSPGFNVAVGSNPSAPAYVENRDAVAISHDTDVHLRDETSGGLVDSVTPGGTTLGSPALFNDFMMVAAGKDIVSLNISTGMTEEWRHTLLEGPTCTPVVAGGIVLIGDGNDVVGIDGSDTTPSETFRFNVSGHPQGIALAYGRAFISTNNNSLFAMGHKPTATIDSITPDPGEQYRKIRLKGSGSDAAAFNSYRWLSDVDGIVAEGPAAFNTTASSLSIGNHTISFQVQDDNWTWSDPVTDTLTVIPSSEWPMYRHDQFHSGQSVGQEIPTNIIKWSKDVTGLDESDVTSSPIIVGDRIYIGTRDAFMHCLDLTTGEELWWFRAGQAIDSSPAFVDGYIIFGSDDRRVYMLDADPSDGIDEGLLDPQQPYDRIWEFETNGPVWSSPTVVNGVAYVTTSPAVDQQNPNHGRLYAIDINPYASNRELWHFVIPNNFPSFSSPLVWEDLVIFGAHDSRVYAVSRITGQEVWNFSTGEAIWSSPAISNGIVYIGSNDNKVYAIHATNGTKAWDQPFLTGDDVYASPAVSDGIVYAGSYDGKLYALNANNGSKEWEFEVQGVIQTSPAIVGDQVIFGSHTRTGAPEGWIHVVNTTSHALTWSRDVKFVSQSSPAVANGIMVIGAYQGTIYAFGDAPDLEVDDDFEFSKSILQTNVQVNLTVTINNLGTVHGNATVNFFDGYIGFGGYKIGTTNVSVSPGSNATTSVIWTPKIPGFRTLIVNLTDTVPYDSNKVNNEVIKIVEVKNQTKGWRMFRGDLPNTGQTDETGPNQDDVWWKYELENETISSPVVADDYVYIGTENRIVALHETLNGMFLWQYPTSAPVEATPAVMNGIVYGASTDGWLFALDAGSGDLLWSKDIGAGFSSPAVTNNTVYIGTEDGALMAFDAITGEEIWNEPVGTAIKSSPAISVDDNAIAIATADGSSSKLSVFNLDDHTHLWTYINDYSFEASPAIRYGQMFIGDLGGNMFNFRVRPLGTGDDKIWNYTVGMPVRSSVSLSNVPARLYFTAGNGTMFSLNFDGTVYWRRNFAPAAQGSILSSPTIAGNKIYVGGDKIYCLDMEKGLEVWSLETSDPVLSSPSVDTRSGRGYVFAADRDGTLYAFANTSLIFPVARIAEPADGTTFRVNEMIRFDASTSTDDGYISRYIWNFGDGTSLLEGRTATHFFENIGNYTVTLLVEDNENPALTSSTNITIHILPNAPPELTNGTIVLESGAARGYTRDDYTFRVEYRDIDDDPPEYVKVVLRYSPVIDYEYFMTPTVSTNVTYEDWTEYYCTTKLPSGNFTHQFFASDGVLPVQTQSFSGPVVWQVGTFTKDEISVHLEYVGQGRVRIETPTAEINPPEGLLYVDKAILTLDDISDWEYIDISVDYTLINISHIIEGTLSLYWHNGTDWIEMPNQRLDRTAKKAGANATKSEAPTLGRFALVGAPPESNTPPNVKFTVNGEESFPAVTVTVNVGDKIKFNGSLTTDNEDVLNDLAFRWRFGDGKEHNNISAEHTYNEAGRYTVNLTVTDTGGAQGSSYVIIEVRETTGNEALIIVAIIIFIVLAIAFALPIRGLPEDEEKEEKEIMEGEEEEPAAEEEEKPEEKEEEKEEPEEEEEESKEDEEIIKEEKKKSKPRKKKTRAKSKKKKR
jgi:outer membrane protein assembly factor BamB/chitodextrinase